jgi:hypothetical protein
MIGQRHEIARQQSDFYRDCFRKTMNWILASIILMICVILVIIYVVLTQPKAQYYASTITGQVIPMTLKQ